jgi:predicted ester cyclase
LLDDNSVAVGRDQPGVLIRGPREFEAFYQRIRGARPDISTTIEDNLGVDDKVIVRWSAEMTHTGDHLGFPATNRTVRITGITIAPIENGKIVRGWDNWGQLAPMQQLSTTAAPAKAAAHP